MFDPWIRDWLDEVRVCGHVTDDETVEIVPVVYGSGIRDGGKALTILSLLPNSSCFGTQNFVKSPRRQ